MLWRLGALASYGEFRKLWRTPSGCGTISAMKTALAPLLLLPLLAGTLTAATPVYPPAPSEIVAAAPAGDWVDIAPDDLLVMTLAPDAKGKPRRVVIQLMPAPFSQGWVSNIRALAKARWYDGIAIVRVQDNYVVQWGDPDGEDAKKAKPLPAGLPKVPESDYVYPRSLPVDARLGRSLWPQNDVSHFGGFIRGFPFAGGGTPDSVIQWPVHCYGSVGVGRGLSPDTGSGAELYTVIGHAPRHLDRNIAVVGRVIAGIEQLSSLPRGTGTLGFYESAAERVAIRSVRLASTLPAAEQPKFQYLSTDSDSFARYADARANRHDEFFITPAGGADICNVPVPIRRKP